MGRFTIGTSGWRYPGWRGDFYPAGLRQADELTYLSQHLNGVEINGSFYSLQTPQRYTSWRDATGDGFTFAVKGSRYITHMKRLHDPGPGIDRFFDSGPLALGDKLGPFLWQLPENLPFDEELLDGFLTRIAAKGWRHALEPRHRSYAEPRCLALLRAHNVALVCADSAGRFPQFRELTTDFIYVRLHGHEELYHGSYRPDLIATWARRIQRMAGERDAYVFFDNDADGAAPWDAIALAQILAE